ncbi:MAG: hypothetical protein N5P05_000833 [Chroococcopsis gigantea SAG 12.99]|nr:hypothetical protein [Chroococcopsis gigantea SAG 12.99]
MTLESSIRWDSIALAPSRMLIYKYSFLDPAVQNINRQQTEQIRRSVAETMCQNDDVKILLDNDVKFNFKYHARQGKFLTEVFFNRSDCR